MRLLAVTCLMMLTFSLSMAQGGEESWLLVGTYSNEDNSNGIQVYRFNTGTGGFDFVSKSTDVTNPSYLAVGTDWTRVFSVSEVGQGKGEVHSFSFDPSSGMLSRIVFVTSAVDHSCSVSMRDDPLVVYVDYDSSEP